MFGAIGRFLLYVFGFEQPVRLVRQRPGENWEDVSRQLAEDQRVEAEVRTSGYITPATVGETITEAWRIATEEGVSVFVQWKGGLPVITRHGPGGIVKIDPETFPNTVKSGRMSVPSFCSPKSIPAKYIRDMVKSAADQPGEPITMEMLDQASKECSKLLTYPVFEDPATMKRAAEPDEARKLYALYHG